MKRSLSRSERRRLGYRKSEKIPTLPYTAGQGTVATMEVPVTATVERIDEVVQLESQILAAMGCAFKRKHRYTWEDVALHTRTFALDGNDTKDHWFSRTADPDQSLSAKIGQNLAGMKKAENMAANSYRKMTALDVDNAILRRRILVYSATGIQRIIWSIVPMTLAARLTGGAD